LVRAKQRSRSFVAKWNHINLKKACRWRRSQEKAAKRGEEAKLAAWKAPRASQDGTNEQAGLGLGRDQALAGGFGISSRRQSSAFYMHG
jgi:hypothetical protein